MQPSEPASPDEDDDIPFAKYEPMFPNLEPTIDRAPENPEPPYLVRSSPDPACRFVVVEALIVLACCLACVWFSTTARKLVDSRPWLDAITDPFGARDQMRRRDLVFSFLLGLGPSCPLILLNQYLLRKRRSWPTVPEWAWLYAGVWTTCFVASTVCGHYKVSLGIRLPSDLQQACYYIWALSHVLLFGAGFAVVLAIFEQPSRGWKCMAWTDWLAVVSTPILIVIVIFDAESVPPL